MPPPAAQYRALLTFMSELHECASLRELEHTITARIADVIPADLVSLNKIDLTGTMGGSIGLFVPERVPPSVIEPAFDKYLHQHPLVQAIKRDGNGSPRRMSDFIDMDEFRTLELYEYVFKPLGVLHQLGFSIGQVPGMVVGIGVNRLSPDFTDDELETCTLLYHQLPAAFHHVQLREIVDHEQGAADRPDLTPREREILLSLRAGMTNQQIAEALILGRRTVEKHLEKLYEKLGVRSRAAAVATVWPAPTV
ncbi:helix-turn-helix transcriptional regulator [Jatrophihabitans endophyticus]|uniref:helix-turn-helix transcriptional regulator n=1 Tax=Jatrophihabitans endophyticus TaxID=1206085 RepID=UPI0019F6ED5E|nr:helix-turn-helix transcriptional regulator [Jatrophihabitans endophyticus]MBE7188724.1 helix-turn-helix transcriptional regulator [Jatrophihabitans endophyticus]